MEYSYRNLAICYNQGTTWKKILKSFQIFLAAAMRGFVQAQYTLSVVYTGKLGRFKDYTKAYAWFMICKDKINKDLTEVLSYLKNNMDSTQMK